jgi:hypothetical protein
MVRFVNGPARPQWELETMNTGTIRINGIRFTDTYSTGAVRFTHRFFIDGKLVSRAIWLEAMEAAKQAETVHQAEIAKRGEG